jgi:hypothetical protein
MSGLRLLTFASAARRCGPSLLAACLAFACDRGWATPVVATDHGGGRLGRVIVDPAGKPSGGGMAGDGRGGAVMLTLYHLDLVYGAPVPGTVIARRTADAGFVCAPTWLGGCGAGGFGALAFDFTGILAPERFIFSLAVGAAETVPDDLPFGYGIVWGRGGDGAGQAFTATSYQWIVSPGTSLFGTTGAGSSAFVPAITFEAVPEPVGGLLYGAIALALLARRRIMAEPRRTRMPAARDVSHADACE